MGNLELGTRVGGTKKGSWRKSCRRRGEGIPWYPSLEKSRGNEPQRRGALTFHLTFQIKVKRQVRASILLMTEQREAWPLWTSSEALTGFMLVEPRDPCGVRRSRAGYVRPQDSGTQALGLESLSLTICEILGNLCNPYAPRFLI